MPAAASGHSASLCGGLVYIVGAGEDNNEFLRFDPALEAWSTLAPTSVQRKYGASFVLGGCVYAVGGYRSTSSSNVERYDVATDTWTAVAQMLEGREMCSAITIGSAGPPEEQDLFDSLIAKATN